MIMGMCIGCSPYNAEQSVITQAIAVLRRFGTDAHVYLPGVGMMNGLQAGNYIDSAGTTQGTVDQPVGLVLDAAGSLGVELASIKSGSAVALSGNICLSSNSVVANKSYRVEFDYVVSSGSVQANIGNVANTSVTGTGKFSNITTPSSGGAVAIGCNASTASITNFTVREVTGIHASQPTTASKPILRRGAVNLLTYSGDFSNAAWGKSNITPTANSATRANASTAFLQSIAVSIPVGSAGTIAVLAKPKTTGGAIGLRFTGTYPNRADATFNLSTGSVIGSAASTFTGQVASVTGPDSNGYYLCVLSATVAGSTGVAGLFGPCELTAGVNGWEAGSSVLSDCFIGGAALFQGTYTAAQIQALGGIPTTTTAPASTALGPQYWSFDGSNDSLSLGSAPFQMSDDHWVVAVASTTSFSNSGVIAAVAGDSTALSVKRLAGLMFDNAGAIRAGWYDGTNYNTWTYGATVNTVYVATARKIGSTGDLRVNGVQRGVGVLTANFTANAGSLGTYPGGGTNLHSGAIYPIAFGKGTMTDADLLLIEKALGQIAGVQI